MTSNQLNYEAMRRFSADIRIETVRMIGNAGFGHIGGAASLADVLAALYGGLMKINPAVPEWEKRDYLVLSKGHCAPALYAALALKGYFPMDWLKTLNQPKTRLPSHADGKLVPGVDMSTGSLGQGISAALGIAMGNKVQGKSNWTYCIVGDGETNEGEVWEACQTAAHNHVDHFIVFVDWNKKQLDGSLQEICDPIDLEKKFQAFGFETYCVDGTSCEQICDAVIRAKAIEGKPKMILLDTIKGLGISFAEHEAFNHYMTFDSAKAEEAVAEIERRLKNGTYPRDVVG